MGCDFIEMLFNRYRNIVVFLKVCNLFHLQPAANVHTSPSTRGLQIETHISTAHMTVDVNVVGFFLTEKKSMLVIC